MDISQNTFLCRLKTWGTPIIEKFHSYSRKKQQLIIVGICAFFVLVLVSTFSGGDSPEDVVNKFSKAVVAHKYEKAVQYFEPEMRPMLLNLFQNQVNNLLEMYEGCGFAIDDKAKAKIQKDFINTYRYKVLKSTKKGDEASVEVEHKDTDEEIVKETLRLKKIDGKWLLCN